MKKSTATNAIAFGGVGLAFLAGVLASSLRKRRLNNALAGQVVLITGSSRGLGLALAEEFGRHGAKLVLTARDPEELSRAVEILARRLKRVPEEIMTLDCDLRSADEVETLVETVQKRLGRIDILVNNAGIITVGPVENQTLQDFRNTMNANFFSGVQCTLAVLPEMLRRRDGKIVNIASIGGKVAVPHLLPYTASKFAMVGFSEGLGAELHSKGINVTTVCPGLMRTGSHLNALFTGDAAREYRWFSLGASLPGLSISASAAARKIVDAVAEGRNELAITPQAILMSRLANLVPGTTAWMMRLANFFLPAAAPGLQSNRRGQEVRTLEMKSAVALGTSAANRYNQSAKIQTPQVPQIPKTAAS